MTDCQTIATQFKQFLNIIQHPANIWMSSIIDKIYFYLLIDAVKYLLLLYFKRTKGVSTKVKEMDNFIAYL